MRNLEEFKYCPYWTKEHYRLIQKVNTFEEIADLATLVLNVMPDGLSQICGPMSTGGLGSIEKNRALFERCVLELRVRNLNPFDQTPLELAIRRLLAEWNKNYPNEYCMPILEVVYRRIFESGKIVKTYFLPGWESSFGARWEREIVTRLGIEINEFPMPWYNIILKEIMWKVVT